MAEGCTGCAHARGNMCHRSDKPYRQSYERKHTDSDFCGPSHRYFEITTQEPTP